MAERYTKTYVSVNVDIDEDGTMLPRLIRWMNGRVFAIEQLGYKCRASSAKVGGGGIRYTVRINGRETYLFQEGSRWFVEARAYIEAPPYRRGLDLCSFSTAFYPPRPMGENTVYIAASRNGAMTMDARQSTMPRLKYFGMKNSAISVSQRRRMSPAYVRRVRKIKSDSRSCTAFGIPDMQKNVEHNVMPPAHKRAVEISVLLVMRCRFLYNNG